MLHIRRGCMPFVPVSASFSCWASSNVIRGSTNIRQGLPLTVMLTSMRSVPSVSLREVSVDFAVPPTPTTGALATAHLLDPFIPCCLLPRVAVLRRRKTDLGNDNAYPQSLPSSRGKRFRCLDPAFTSLPRLTSNRSGAAGRQKRMLQGSPMAQAGG